MEFIVMDGEWRWLEVILLLCDFRLLFFRSLCGGENMGFLLSVSFFILLFFIFMLLWWMFGDRMFSIEWDEVLFVLISFFVFFGLEFLFVLFLLLSGDDLVLEFVDFLLFWLVLRKVGLFNNFGVCVIIEVGIECLVL